MTKEHFTYWQMVWNHYKRHPLGTLALYVVIFFCLVGIYAPFLASSKPLIVQYEGQWYFPLFRYLFFTGFYTKFLDVFYNLMMFTLPLLLFSHWILRKRIKIRKIANCILLLTQFFLFLFLVLRPAIDPSSNSTLNLKKQERLQVNIKALKIDPFTTSPLLPDWQQDLTYLNEYGKLNLVLNYQHSKLQHERLLHYQKAYAEGASKKGKKETTIPTLWFFETLREKQQVDDQLQILNQFQSEYVDKKKIRDEFLKKCQPNCEAIISTLSSLEKENLLQAKRKIDQYDKAQAQLNYLKDKKNWLNAQLNLLHYELMPLLSPYHWEDDVGGEQDLNQYISWWELTRINRKNMVAALIFGIRISLSVGLLAISLALLIGVPLGAIAGYYGGKIDLFLYRLIEIWESMPTFFMLLMIVAFLQSKSIFLVIGVIGLFGWTNFSRFIRGEFLKQKQLPYVEACHALGFNNRRIMFSHLLPNAIPPLLTLIPFAIMSAITSEAGLSFLGLGEEGSSSWGVLMDEGRSAFPSESYLLWPPAILLTLLLVAIAIVGDTLRDALDPKLN